MRIPKLHRQLKWMINVQKLTGLRPGELCKISWEAIDRSVNPWVYRVFSKQKNRAIPIGPKAQAFLKAQAKAFPTQPKNPIFQTRFAPSSQDAGPKPYSTMTYARAINRAAKKAKVAPWHPHQLRHFIATATSAAVTDGVLAAQAALGHSDAFITLRYAHSHFHIASEVAKKFWVTSCVRFCVRVKSSKPKTNTKEANMATIADSDLDAYLTMPQILDLLPRSPGTNLPIKASTVRKWMRQGMKTPKGVVKLKCYIWASGIYTTKRDIYEFLQHSMYCDRAIVAHQAAQSLMQG